MSQKASWNDRRRKKRNGWTIIGRRSRAISGGGKEKPTDVPADSDRSPRKRRIRDDVFSKRSSVGAMEAAPPGRRKLIAIPRRAVSIWGPWPERMVGASSRQTVSLTQKKRFSISQCPRTRERIPSGERLVIPKTVSERVFPSFLKWTGRSRRKTCPPKGKGRESLRAAELRMVWECHKLTRIVDHDAIRVAVDLLLLFRSPGERGGDPLRIPADQGPLINRDRGGQVV